MLFNFVFLNFEHKNVFCIQNTRHPLLSFFYLETHLKIVHLNWTWTWISGCLPLTKFLLFLRIAVRPRLLGLPRQVYRVFVTFYPATKTQPHGKKLYSNMVHIILCVHLCQFLWNHYKYCYRKFFGNLHTSLWNVCKISWHVQINCNMHLLLVICIYE